MKNIKTSVTELIGHTPMMELTHIEKELGLQAKIIAKLEYFNATGSVKDRIAKKMIEDAEEKGILKQGEKVLELTKNEMIIFTYLLSNRGRIVTREDLMTDLWNNNEFINDNALTVNISRLRSKLQEFGLEGKIETRKGQGYKLL